MKSIPFPYNPKLFFLLVGIILLISFRAFSNKINTGRILFSYFPQQKTSALHTDSKSYPVKDSIPKTSEQLILQLKKIIANTLDLKIENIKMESHFTDDLHADELDMVELTMQFEDHFNIKIPDEDAAQFTTVKNTYDYFLKKLRIK